VSVGIAARETDDRELVHCVHVSSPFLLPGCSGGNRKASGSAPKRSRRALLEGTGAQVSLVSRNLPGEPTKQNGGESRAREFKRSRCPGQLGGQGENGSHS
jgi:hypothetical protein